MLWLIGLSADRLMLGLSAALADRLIGLSADRLMRGLSTDRLSGCCSTYRLIGRCRICQFIGLSAYRLMLKRIRFIGLSAAAQSVEICRDIENIEMIYREISRTIELYSNTHKDP